MKTRKLIILINSLECGGAERVAVILSEELQRKGVRVCLVLLEDINRFYDVPNGVELVSFGSNSVLLSVFRLWRLVSHYRPDAILSFLTRSNYINIICSIIARRYLCVISERTYTSRHFSSGFSGFINKLFIRSIYPFSDKTITVSKEVAKDLCDNFDICKNVVTINNPYDMDRIYRDSLDPVISLPDNYICTLGRMEKEKAYDILIRAYMQSGSEADLVIIGSGSQKDNLKKIVSENGFDGRVHFLGLLSNPFPVLRGAKCFILSSVYEGFPNALLEAMCLGVPVVSTNCNQVTESILNGVAETHKPVRAEFGVLVPTNDIEAMIGSMRMLCDDEAMLEHYGRMSKLRARDFSLEKISGEYFQHLFPDPDPISSE